MDRSMENKRLPNLTDTLQSVTDGSLETDGSFDEILPYWVDGPSGLYFRPKGGECEECRIRREVRLKTLEAIGKGCGNLKQFDNIHFLSWGLSAAEWESLLVPMQTHAQLERIRISSMDSADRQTEAQIGPLYRSFIAHAQNITSLHLTNLSPELAAQLALGLQENSNRSETGCKLRKLGLAHWDREADKAKTPLHLGEMVIHAPELKEISLHAFPQLDDETKHTWCKAMKGRANLKRIWISSEAESTGQAGFADVLLDDFTGQCPNSALQRLVISEADLTAEKLALLATGSIEEIVVQSADPALHSFSPAQWQYLGKALHDAPKLKSFELELNVNHWSDQGLESLSAGLAELWTTSEESPRFHVDVRVDFLYAGKLNVSPSQYSTPERQGEMCAFLHQVLDFNFVTKIQICNFFLETVDFKSLIDKLAISTSVEELTPGDYSHVRNVKTRDSQRAAWKYLFQRLEQNRSIKALNLVFTEWLDDDNFKDLMDLLEVNFTLERIPLFETWWECQGKGDLINKTLLRNKRIADHFATLYGARELSIT